MALLIPKEELVLTSPYSGFKLCHLDTFKTNPLFLHWEEGSEQKSLESLHCLFQKFKFNCTYQCVYVGAVHMGHSTCVAVRSQYSGVGSHLHHELQALHMTQHPAIPLALMSYT